MNKTKLGRYRTLLNEQLAALMANNDGTVGRLEAHTQAHADPNDQATAESEQAFDLRLRDRDRKLILKIREALQRIDSGTFGFCEECDEPIDDRRLTARPVTTQCIDCKEEQERKERRERSLVVAEVPAVEARPRSRR